MRDNPQLEYCLEYGGESSLKLFLCRNVWQAGEIERDLKILKNIGYPISKLGLTVKAIRQSQYVGIYPNKIHYINYIYEDKND